MPQNLYTVGKPKRSSPFSLDAGGYSPQQAAAQFGQMFPGIAGQGPQGFGNILGQSFPGMDMGGLMAYAQNYLAPLFSPAGSGVQGSAPQQGQMDPSALLMAILATSLGGY
jgi:hypothetical protein